MIGRKATLAATVVVVLLVVAFFYLPIVPYTQSVDIWFAYKSGVRSCNPPGGVINITNQAEYERCLAYYKYPPANLTGHSALAYRFLGIGDAPSPRQMVVTQGNYSVLVYFRGDKAVAVEYIGELGGDGGVVVNPPGTVAIQNVSVRPLPFGQINFTVMLKNIGSTPIVGGLGAGAEFPAVVSIQFPGYDLNDTRDGLTWIGAAQIGTCADPWRPNTFCRISQTLTNALSPGEPFAYYVEIRGAANNTPFFYKEEFHAQSPPAGITSVWVSQFIETVNQARGAVRLSENNTLDRFASLRFSTAVTQPDISDYGLASDAADFFGGIGSEPEIVEVLLYPGTSDPSTYASELQQYAPGHWSALTNTTYTQYGYFIGSGPYEYVNQPCPVSEIPSGGLNITQFFEQAGCSVSVRQATWLVIIMGK